MAAARPYQPECFLPRMLIQDTGELAGPEVGRRQKVRHLRDSEPRDDARQYALHARADADRVSFRGIIARSHSPGLKPLRSRMPKTDLRVLPQIRNRIRRAVRIEIGSRRAQDEAEVSKPTGSMFGIVKEAAADRDIDSSRDKFDDTVVEIEIERDARVALPKRLKMRGDKAMSDCRHCYSKTPCRLDFRLLQKSLCFLPGLVDPPGALHQKFSFAGQRHAPRRTKKESRSQLVFKARDCLPDSGRRQTQPSRRSREASILRHGKEERYRADLVHDIRLENFCLYFYDKRSNYRGQGVNLCCGIVQIEGTAMDNVTQTGRLRRSVSGAVDRLAGYVGGVWHPEDIVALEGTPWIVVSAMRSIRDRGALFAIDASADLPAVELDWLPPAATGRVSRAAFDPHGIDARKTGEGTFELLVVDHGAGEAIDKLTVEIRDGRPVITAGSRIEKPVGTSGNAIAHVPQGGFVMTSMFDPRDADFIGKFSRAETTGGIWRWTEAGWSRIGPDLSGANGIAVSANGRWIFVSEWAGRKVWRLSMRGDVEARVDVDFLPDNLRWNRDGSLLLAGQCARPEDVFGCEARGEPCPMAFKVVRVGSHDMAVSTLFDVDQREAESLGFGGATGAMEVGDRIWVASFMAERVARFRASPLS